MDWYWEWLLEHRDPMLLGVLLGGITAKLVWEHYKVRAGANKACGYGKVYRKGRDGRMASMKEVIAIEDAIIEGIEAKLYDGHIDRGIATHWYNKLARAHGLTGLLRGAKDPEELRKRRLRLLKAAILRKRKELPNANKPVNIPGLSPSVSKGEVKPEVAKVVKLVPRTTSAAWGKGRIQVGNLVKRS